MSMLEVRDEKIPLRENEGIVFIGDGRVTLDCVVEMFDHGASPEEIAEEYDSLALADVYAVIAYYLRNRDEVNAYLEHRAEESEEARRILDRGFPNHLREKLLRAKRDRESRGDSLPPRR
jgi:uncharacterized protein (DUF433 family)